MNQYIQQIQYLFGKIRENIFQVNSLILEINNIINQSILNNQNNNFIPMNNLNYNINFNPNFNAINNQIMEKPKINVIFEMVNIQNNNFDLNEKIPLNLDNDISINEMLILFLKKIGREDCINEEKIGFLYSGCNLRLKDYTKIKDLFGITSGVITIKVHNLFNLIN